MNGGGGYGGGYDEVPVYGEKNRYLKYIPWAFYVLLFVLVLYNVIIALVYAFIDSRWAHFMLIMVLLLTYLSIGFMLFVFQRNEDIDWKIIVMIVIQCLVLVLVMAITNAYVWPAFQPKCPGCFPPTCPSGIYFTEFNTCETGSTWSDCSQQGECISFNGNIGYCQPINSTDFAPRTW